MRLDFLKRLSYRCGASTLELYDRALYLPLISEWNLSRIEEKYSAHIVQDFNL